MVNNKITAQEANKIAKEQLSHKAEELLSTIYSKIRAAAQQNSTECSAGVYLGESSVHKRVKEELENDGFTIKNHVGRGDQRDWTPSWTQIIWK